MAANPEDPYGKFKDDIERRLAIVSRERHQTLRLAIKWGLLALIVCSQGRENEALLNFLALVL